MDGTKLRALADNSSHDDVDKVFQPLARLVLSKDHQVYVLDSNYSALLTVDKETKKLLVFAVRRPTMLNKFASCLIMAAEFKETLFYKLWSRIGVKFVEETELKERLRFNAHPNGSLAKFYYGYEANWSKALKNSKDHDLTDRLVHAGISLMADKKCLLLRNKVCKKTKLLTRMPNFESLPGKSHGQNHFQDIDNVFVLAAYNLQRPAQTFLDVMFGIDPESTKRSIMGYEIYQGVMRSSLRNIDSNTSKIIVVPDRATAEYLIGLFPGSSCESLGLEQPISKRQGPKAVYVSSAEKQRANRKKLKEERVGFVKEIELATNSGLRDLSQMERDGFTLESLGNSVSLFRGTIIKDFKQKDPEKSLYVSDKGPFIAELRRRFKLRYANKEDNAAISPACFKTVSGSDKVTGAVNVWFASGIWLDLDDTDLKPHEFAKMFPDLLFVAYSTYSHTRACLRYRVCILASGIMSNQHYRNIVQQIVHKVESTGEFVGKLDPSTPNKKVHGIEHKWDASNKFYLPCKPGDGGAGFLTVFDGDGRLPLDINDWLENSVVPFEGSLPPALIILPDGAADDELTPLQAHIAEDALTKFKSAPARSGHVMFYKLHRRLLHNGIRGVHWHTVMSQAVSGSKSPAKRRKEMEEYMKQAW
ncbi:hypothetical protein FV222_09200 [Methylobacterium sp. WL103]|uniref:hypothetical protein n=1 Tax=Methylobacterium sp. WL103 TaxID=2603891 RepID=UPI0011C8E9FE|nr:hypothetical protein [Methylobacterium sp. WL103]TXN02799.1 hypothetical protein FV222_09200 [Methylobacterium sp. WL103]